MRLTFYLPRVFFCASIVTVLLFLIIITKFQNVIELYTVDDADAQNVKPLILRNDNRKINLAEVRYEKVVISDNDEVTEKNTVEQGPRMKYILQYTNPRGVPFVYMGVGQEGFVSNDCPFINCVVTGDRNYLGDIKKFDVVAFAGPQVVRMSANSLPKERSPHQKYVFGTIESSHYYPVCSNKLDGFFNWTWTFRLDSEVRWGYMDIRDAQNNLIGPNKIMHWMRLEDMDPVSDDFKVRLKTKTTAGAWFVSNCFDKSGRLQFAKDLQNELKKYDLVLDIYGGCGTKKCPGNKHDECMKMVEDSYYFYMSFENSFSEDYATEKLLMALKVNVVPVVYGGANYSRFMPDGIYLNARELGPEKLAAKMDELIKNPEEYANYFKWKKYYSYQHKHDRPETNEYCKMCELLNDEEKLRKTSIVQNFREWWDSPKMC